MRCCQFWPQAMSVRSWKMWNSSPVLHLDLGGEPFPERGELAVVVLVVKPGVAHERRWLACHAITSRPCPKRPARRPAPYYSRGADQIPAQ